MKQIREVLRLHLLAQLSSRKIQGATGVARTTIQDYILRCKKANIISVDELIQIDDDTLYLKLFGKPTHKSSSSTKLMPDYNYVHQELKQSKQDKTKVTLSFLWERYKEEHGEQAYEYTQYRVYYKRYKQKLNPSMRQVHIAGEKLFVDYSGVTLPLHNAITGEITKAQVFVAVLGASGYTFVHVTPSQKQEDFILSHVQAYNFFGGTPTTVVPDNLKSAIISNNKKGIVVNESYASLARHYNMRVEPARPRKPKDKPKAEQGVQGIQRYILACFRHTKFFSINEMNDAIGHLLDRYNHKVMKHLGKSRTELFELLDKPALTPLPTNRFTYEQFKIARVSIDYHIILDKCYYSVPYKYLKEQVEVRYSTTHVRIYHKNSIIAIHPRLSCIGATSTLHEHMPTQHQYVDEKMNPQRLRSWAKNIGKYSAEFVETTFKKVEHQANAYRQIVAVLSLAKRYGEMELELALMYALDENILRVKSITSILDKKLYMQKSGNNTNQETPLLFNTHQNLRGPNNYS
jgi:transposase